MSANADISGLGRAATHPLLQVDALDTDRMQPAPKAAEGGLHLEHPLLTFDPFTLSTSSVLGGSSALDASSQLRLKSFAPPDFAAELDYHNSPDRCIEYYRPCAPALNILDLQLIHVYCEQHVLDLDMAQ